MKNSMIYLNYQCDTLASNCDIHECGPEKRWRQILSATKRHQVDALLHGISKASMSLLTLLILFSDIDGF